MLNKYIDGTLKDFYYAGMKNFETFSKLTKNIIFGQDTNGQLKMIFVDNIDELSEYFNHSILHIEEVDSTLHIIIKVTA